MLIRRICVRILTTKFVLFGEFMRKIILIAFVCMLIYSVTGCDKLKNGIFGGGSDTNGAPKAETPVPDTERSELEGAVMKYVANTEKSLTVEMSNGTDSVWQSGNMRDYSLECERDGVWYTVEPKGDFANTMELMLFGPGDTLTHTFEFGERYGTLPAGKYRVVKSWWANATDTREAGEFYLVCEFTVG